VDFGSVIELKNQVLGQAYAAFRGASGDPLRAEYAAFLARERGWLDDFALFMALKSANGGAAWTDWPPELALRERGAMDRAADELADAIEQQRFRQFLFSRQWERLRRRAVELGVRIREMCRSSLPTTAPMSGRGRIGSTWTAPAGRE
jgi:4-alpha-glucanotransferase